jgi:hypothetical protein
LPGIEPLHHRSGADHDRDPRRRDDALEEGAAEEFVNYQTSNRREQDPEAKDMQGMPSAHDTRARHTASQEGRLGRD